MPPGHGWFSSERRAGQAGNRTINMTSAPTQVLMGGTSAGRPASEVADTRTFMGAVSVSRAASVRFLRAEPGCLSRDARERPPTSRVHGRSGRAATRDQPLHEVLRWMMSRSSTSSP
jgi:hypothetical protein